MRIRCDLLEILCLKNSFDIELIPIDRWNNEEPINRNLAHLIRKQLFYQLTLTLENGFLHLRAILVSRI